MKTKFNGILTLLLAFMVQFTFAQERTISGVVSDEMGPVSDITVKVKGTNTGTVTDFDGNYTIKVKTGDVIEFTHIGYVSVEKIVGSSNTVNAKMSSTGTDLDEIVVTGVAGATNRNKLSVTVNKVSSKDLEFAPTNSAESILQGKVAGITVTNLGQPGEGANIQLRGATNLFGTQKPLILIDGVIVEGGLADVNSDDISSFEIVKGASASALYGSRAGNGVVVISTKKGKKGRVDVTIKTETGFSKINNFLELNTSHHYKLAPDWENFQGMYTKYDGVTYPSNYNGSDYGQVIGSRLQDDDHYSDNQFGVKYDAQDQFFKTGVNTTLYASVATGSDNSNLFFSAEKSNTEGVLKETKGYERLSARLNGDIQIKDWLKFNVSNNFIRTINHTPGGTGGIFFQLSVTEPDVDLTAPNLDGQPYLFVPSLWNSTTTNPIYPLFSNPELRKNNKYLGSYKLNFKFTNYLNLDAEYAIESINSKFTDYRSSNVYQSGGTQQELYSVYRSGDLFMTNYNNLSQKAQITLNFKKKYNELVLTSKVSYLLEDSKYNYFSAYGVDEIFAGRTISLDNYNTQFISSDNDNQTAKNLFGIVGLDYKDRYIFDAMYRVDESSLFGANQRKHSYYRVSGAYRISKDFDIKGVQELKIHAAHGTAGQRPGYDWQYSRIPLINGNLGLNRTKFNENLKPSKTSEFELGVTSKFLDRVNLELVYSKAKTEDQFMLVDIFPPTNQGNNKQWQNIGTVEFNSLEATIDINIVKNKPLTWDLGVVFDKTKNEITQLDVNPITVGPNNGEVFRIEEGVEFGSMFGREFVTSLDQMTNQLPVGSSINDYSINGDGVVVLTSDIGTISEAAIILLDENGDDFYGKIGSSTPDFKLGVRNSLSYKGFNLYTLIDWKKGGDIYNKNGQWLTRDNRSAIVDQTGVAENQKKTVDYYQSLYDTNNYNGYWVEDGSYVKLRELSLFYTLNSDKLKNVLNGFFNSMRIGVTGTNLFTITDYSGWDPEVQSYDDDTLQYYSVDFEAYPVNSTYTFSFTLKF